MLNTTDDPGLRRVLVTSLLLAFLPATPVNAERSWHARFWQTDDGLPDNTVSGEHEIVGLLAKGFLYKEIADQLAISLSTVRAHLHAVYEKLHVQSRTQAVVKYRETGS